MAGLFAKKITLIFLNDGIINYRNIFYILIWKNFLKNIVNYLFISKIIFFSNIIRWEAV
jgi:hypothetical protein